MQTSSERTSADYRLQRAGPEHADLLLYLYASQRDAELRAFGLPAEQRRLLLEQQWRARNESYAARYPEAIDQIVLRAGQPVGRLLTQRTTRALHLIDVALLPEHQNCGLGTQVLCDLQRECAAAERTIALHVARDNPAQRLYARLGFLVVEQGDVYLRMEWTSR